MSKSQLPLMLVICLGLGGLVWLDNQSDVKAPRSANADVALAPENHVDDQDGAKGDLTVSRAEPSAYGNPLASLKEAQLRDTVERPLFAPSRRPPPADGDESAMPGPAVSDPASYELLGVVRDGPRAIALLRKAGEATSFRVEPGDSIGGWRVAKVESAAVVLERSDGTSLAVPLRRK